MNRIRLLCWFDAANLCEHRVSMVSRIDTTSSSVGLRLIPYRHFSTAMTFYTTKIVLLVCFLGLLSECSANGNYARAVVESCQGCQLNRLPDVKKFIFEDVPHYDRVEFKHIQGAPPDLVLYDKNDEIVERLQLSRLTREECNDLLASKGFARDTKPAKDEI